MNFPRLLTVSAFAVLVSGAAISWQHAAAADAAAEPKPYGVKGNKVDKVTYRGFLYYGDLCMRCHGPDGAGSSYAPALVDSLKHMDKQTFEETVVNGRNHVDSSNDKVMPSFGLNQDAMDNLDNIYAYLKARSDGALGRGHPEHMDE